MQWGDSARPRAGSGAYLGRFPDFFTGFIAISTGVNFRN
jgi:hypothetical protein